MAKLRGIKSLVVVAGSLFLGCSLELSKANSYPCDFGVYSKFNRTIRIIECDGMGTVYPDGLIPKTSSLAPSKTFFFPRQKWLPDRFRIRWAVDSEEFSQELKLPQVEKGSNGMLRLELSAENTWTLTFAKENAKAK